MKKYLLIILIGLMTLPTFTSCSTEDVPTVEQEIINNCNCPDIGIEILSIMITNEVGKKVMINGVDYYDWGDYTIEVDCEEIELMDILTIYQYHQPTLDELPYHIGQCVDL